jgi:hypothetical protein
MLISDREDAVSLKDQHQSITIQGIVCHSDWNDDSEASQVSIFTFDDDEYVVASEDEVQFLLHQTGVEVLARGHLLPEFEDRKVIRVESLTVFGSMSSEASGRDNPMTGEDGLSSAGVRSNLDELEGDLG